MKDSRVGDKENRMERQRGELGAMAPTMYGLTSPSSTDLGQKARVLLVFTVKSLLAAFYVMVSFSYVKEGST